MEKHFIEWLIQQQANATQDPTIAIGIGDDAALVEADGPIIIATDTIADGTHFDAATHTLEEIGHKAMAVNLSDIAAMGAQGYAATVNLLCPQDFGIDELQRLFAAIDQTARQYNTSIIGGDTNRWSGQLVITITAYGKPISGSKSGVWKKSGAQAEDVVLASGDFGGSIAGKHLRFQPRIGLAEYLAPRYEIHSCTDVTDSLALDLFELASAAQLGFCIDSAAIAISSAAHALSAHSGRTALAHALYDGEDFELLFSTDRATAKQILSDQDLPVSVAKIGELDSSQQYRIGHNGTAISELYIDGYRH